MDCASLSKRNRIAIDADVKNLEGYRLCEEALMSQLVEIYPKLCMYPWSNSSCNPRKHTV